MSEGQRIRAFMQTATREQSSLATRAISLKVLTGVVMRTPVDSGRARGNWNTAIGRASGTVSDNEDKGGGRAISEGAATIAQQRGFSPIVLDNNLPYIGKLDDGSSQQAPAGMVALTLAGLGLSPGRES